MDNQRSPLETGGFALIVLAVLIWFAVANGVASDALYALAGPAVVGGVALIAIGRTKS